MRWGDPDLTWIGRVYPPLSSALASLLGGNSQYYVLVAAAVVALSFQRLTGILVREGFGTWATAAVMLAGLGAPPTLYLVGADLQSVLSIALIALALDGIGSFVEHGSTEAGFRAGLALGVAVMVDPAAWVYALALAAVAPFFARHTSRSGRAAHLATVTVLLFPAVAAIGFWLYLQWWFDVSPWLTPEHVASVLFPSGAASAARTATQGVLLGLAVSPLALVAMVFRAAGNRWSLIAPTIAVAGLWGSLWLGLRTAGGHTYLLMLVLYVSLLAVRHPSSRRKVLITVSALAQLTLAWWASLAYNGPLRDWLIHSLHLL